MTELLEGVTWYGRSSVRIRTNGVDLHVDPWGVADPQLADYVLLTHPHYDNFSELDIERLQGPDTVLIAPASMRKQLFRVDHLMRPGDLLQLEDLDVLAVPAYNNSRRFHPRGSQWLGYVFTLGDVTFYHAGHTDFLDSMHNIRCDVAFLPCDTRYTMGPEDVARAAGACEPALVVPIHWDSPGGSRDRAREVSRHHSGAIEILEARSGHDAQAH